MSTRNSTIREGDNDPRHGTMNGYSNLGCRCANCTDAWAAYRREVLQPNRLARPLLPDDPRHGTENLYGNYGCRCLPCTDAWSAASMERWRRRRQTAQARCGGGAA